MLEYGDFAYSLLGLPASFVTFHVSVAFFGRALTFLFLILLVITIHFSPPLIPSIYMSVCLYVCMSVCLYVCMFACLHVCMSVCLRMYVYVYSSSFICLLSLLFSFRLGIIYH